MKRFILSVISVLLWCGLCAQNDMFRGRDFWVTSVQVAMSGQVLPSIHPNHLFSHQGAPSDSALLYIVSNTPCTGHVRNPVTNFSRQFTVVPGTATIIKVPSDDIMVWLPDTMSRLSSENQRHAFSIQGKGVEVVTSEDVYVYLQTNNIADTIGNFVWNDVVYQNHYHNCFSNHPPYFANDCQTSLPLYTLKVPVPAAKHGRCEYRQLQRKMPWATHTLLFVAMEDDTWLDYEIVDHDNTVLYADSRQLQAGEVAVVSTNDGNIQIVNGANTDTVNRYLFVNARTNCKKMACYVASHRRAYRTFNPYVPEFLADGKDFITRKFQNRKFKNDVNLFHTVYDSAARSYCLNEMFDLHRKYPSDCLAFDSSYAHETFLVYTACSLSPSVGNYLHPGPIEVPYVYHRFPRPFFQNYYLWKDTTAWKGYQTGRGYVNLPTIYFNALYDSTYSEAYGMVHLKNACLQKARNTFPFRFTDRMTTHWICPTTKRNVQSRDFPIDTVYCDLTVYVHSDGLHSTTLNGQAVPASAFEPVPQTNQEYYCAQFAYYNDDVPDVIQIENPNGFCAYLDEFGFKEYQGEFFFLLYDSQYNPVTDPDFLYLVYYHDNASWVDLLESPYSHSNLSTDDSATVYRCLGDTLHLDVGYNLDSLEFDWIVDGIAHYNTRTLDLPITDLHTITAQLVIHQQCPDTTTTFVRVVPPPVIPFSSDTILCAGATLSIESTEALYYQWSTGDTTPAITIDSAGIYSVTAANLGCTARLDSFRVDLYEPSHVNFGDDSTLCDLATLLLDAAQTHPATYEWQDHSTNTTYTVVHDGEYWVVVTDHCLGASDTIAVEYLHDFDVNLGTDTTLCEGDELVLSADLPFCSYHWQDGSTEPRFVVRQPGIYSVTATNFCYSHSDDIDIAYEPCAQELWVPNSFTPDGDGLNDRFVPVFSYPGEVEQFEMTVYDRWGSMIFLTTDMDAGWDGGDKPEGMYVWVIRYKTALEGMRVEKGSVMLGRR